MAKFYAVREGRKTGIFTTWAECKEQVDKYNGAVYKSFPTIKEAQAYLDGAESDNKSPNFEDYLSNDTCVAYVDGSNTETQVGASAILVLGASTDNSEMLKSRNVSGEVNSAVMAISSAIKIGKKKIVVIHDFLGIRCWANGEWDADSDIAQKYVRFIKNVSDKIEIEFVHVKGHTGNMGNEMADIAAKTMAGVL